MKALLTCNLSDNSAKAGDALWQPPALTFRETLTLALRFERTVAGERIEPDLTIDWLQCSLGYVDARPLRGDWALQVGAGAQSAGNTTSELSYAATPQELQAAINAKTAVVTAYGAASVKQRDGSWWIIFATATAAVPMQVRDNTLFPLSFGQVNAVEIDGVWHHEVRLIQLPVDSTTVSERILPPAPTVTEVQAGATSGDFKWNEIQRLYVRPDFRATYYLEFGYARTAHLSKDDGPEEILAALAAVLGDNFATTLAADFTIDIEFTGADYAGAPQPLIEVVPVAPPPGDLTFSLPLNRAALLAWLRVAEAVAMPLEVMIGVTEDGEESVITPIRTNLVIRRPLNWAELEENPNVDWLRPASPRDYIPRSTNTVFTGDKSAAYVVGDGVADEFAVAHPFATVDVHVFVHENVTNGRQLTEGTDYSVVINSTGEVTVTALGDAPEEDAWTVYVRAMEPIAAFAEDLEISIGQVTGLEARLDALETAVDDLQTLLPRGTLVRPASSGTVAEIEIPASFVVYPNLRLGPDFDAGSIAALSAPLVRTFPSAAVRPPGLLPAIRDTSVTTFSTADLPASPTAGNVYQNIGSDPVLVPGGLGRRGRYLAVNEYAGYDGRVWYHLTRGSAASTSWFPTDFHEEMIAPITFERDTWRAAQQFVLEFDLAVQLLRASSNAQWLLVIEHGAVPSETDATATAIDLTTAGTGTHTAYQNGTALGTFTANATTNVLTLTGTPPADGDVLQVANSGGALPGGLLALTDYVVRDYSAGTFKLAPLTTTLSLRDVEWNSTPLLTQRLAVSALRQTRRFGCRVLRSAANVMSAEQMKSAAWSVADSTPATPRFALRVRLIDFDTENSVTGATGYAWAALTAATASITS